MDATGVRSATPGDRTSKERLAPAGAKDRKILKLQGAGLKAFGAMIAGFCREQSANPAVAGLVGPLADKAREWEELTVSVAKAAAANPEEVGAASYDYLMYSGYVTLAYWWARSVAAAEASDQPEAFKAGKRETARFYFERVLPRTLAHAAAIRSGAGSLMSLDADHFDG